MARDAGSRRVHRAYRMIHEPGGEHHPIRQMLPYFGLICLAGGFVQIAEETRDFRRQLRAIPLEVESGLVLSVQVLHELFAAVEDSHQATLARVVALVVLQMLCYVLNARRAHRYLNLGRPDIFLVSPAHISTIMLVQR